ncbi:centromere-associated protein E-like isoform X1 [Stylophora pistillata]|uniref:Uncharacterized protein n=2 Tax=Stylophora pistillata TaxID=50429 RepID=A0A2B4S7E1_STYPI|nr:centromere-associated protein E-like isoform X1 [Stylophora pistillata]PFX24478.1 hypothetical protein AWC38_SpisGene10911 [Stylophora pistillata]
MDDVTHSCEHEEQNEAEDLDTAISLVADFNNYDCFLQPFNSPEDIEGDELEIKRVDELGEDGPRYQGFMDEEGRKTGNDYRENSMPRLEMDFKESDYHRNLGKLQRLVEDKFQELQEITSAKEELERGVQTALQKLWVKEAELHNQRQTSLERERCLIDDLRQESGHSEELESLVQSLKTQKEEFQEQLVNLNQQLCRVKRETERENQKLHHKSLELQNTRKSRKKTSASHIGQITGVLSNCNEPKERATALNLSPYSIVGESSDISSSEERNDSGESLEDDTSAEVTMIDLQQQNHDLRMALESFTAHIADLWQKVNAGCDLKNGFDEEEETMVLLNNIAQSFYQQNAKIVDLEEQNARQLSHLQEVEEAHCFTQGKIHRLWVKFCVQEKGENQTTRTQGITSSTKATDVILNKIEDVLSSNRCTTQENEELSRVKASLEKKIVDLRALLEKVREDHGEISEELEKKNAKIEETKFSLSKAIEDKDIELEILKEQLQETEKKKEQLKAEREGCESRGKCTDEVLQKLLRSKERALEDYQRKSEKELATLWDEVKDLQESLHKAKQDKSDLQEYCDLLKEDIKRSEIYINSLEEGEKSLKGLLEQGKKKEEKLYLTARELYDEIKTRKQEAQSHESAIAVLQEKIKSLELKLETVMQERQIDKKNLKNAKETEQYLQSSLQQALGEVIQMKTSCKNEENIEEARQETTVHTADEHRASLDDSFKELERLVEYTLERNARDLQEYAARIEALCEENSILKGEVDAYKERSSTLIKNNRRLKTLSRALKDDLVEEMRDKKELEISVITSNEKSEFASKEGRGFDEQSTISQLPMIGEDSASCAASRSASPSSSDLQSVVRRQKGKGLARRRIIPKAISKRLSSYSLNLKANKNGDMEEGRETVGKENEAVGDTSAMAECEQRLRSILMAVQRDKDELQQEVASLSDELQRERSQLQTHGNITNQLREETTRNVRESVEMKKALEAIHNKTRSAYTMINKDIQSLLEISKKKDKELRKFESSSGKAEKENADLMLTVATLREQLQDDATLKEIITEEARQLRESLQKVIESKEKILLQPEPLLLINNLNTDIVLPQMGKHEVRTILKDVLTDLEHCSSEEVIRLNQKSAELVEELSSVRKDNEYLKGLIDRDVHEELHRAGERITYLNGQLKIFQERQNTLREAALMDRVKANGDAEKFFERYAELKVTLKGKEETLEQYKESEDVLMTENSRLQEEIDLLKLRFGVEGLSPTTKKAEVKRELEGWKRKCQRMQEHFERESQHLQEENSWLHKQLSEESTLCEELQRCKSGLEESLKGAEEKIKQLHQKLEDRQEGLACLEEMRVVLETKISCLQKVNDDLQTELSKERSEADKNIMKIRNEFAATAKDLKRHQQEGNNLVTKVFLLENTKEKLEQELQEKERKMMVNSESFTEERSRLTERVRDLRISLEEEVRRRLDLEEKMQQIVKISVMEGQKDRLKTNKEQERNLAGTPTREYNNNPGKSSMEAKVPVLPVTFITEASETTEDDPSNYI